MRSLNVNGFGFLLFALVLISGCGDDTLPKVYKLDRLRVLALTTATPEVDPGTAGITITPYVSDPDGGGRLLTPLVETCVDFGVGYGATPTCIGNPTRTVLGVQPAAFTPSGGAPHYFGTGTTFNVSVPAAGTVFADPLTGSSRSAADQYNGVAYLVIYQLTTPSGEVYKSFRRIVVSSVAKVAKNQNPSITQVTLDGVASGIATTPTSPIPLFAVVPSTDAESYNLQDSSGGLSTRTEELSTSWLISSGTVSRSRTDRLQTTTFTPLAPAPGSTQFVVVLRDDRGGAAVASFTK